MARRITDLQKSVKELHAEMAVISTISSDVSDEVDRDATRALVTASTDTVHLLQEGQKGYYAVETMCVLPLPPLAAPVAPSPPLTFCLPLVAPSSCAGPSAAMCLLDSCVPSPRPPPLTPAPPASAANSCWLACWRLRSWTGLRAHGQ
jgi:hypothetical protein